MMICQDSLRALSMSSDSNNEFARPEAYDDCAQVLLNPLMYQLMYPLMYPPLSLFVLVLAKMA